MTPGRGSKTPKAKSRPKPRPPRGAQPHPKDGIPKRPRTPKPDRPKPRPKHRPRPRPPVPTPWTRLLASVPGLKNAIVWRRPSTTQVTGIPTAYPQWTAAQKKELEDTWSSIVNGTFRKISFTPSVSLTLDTSGELFSTELKPAPAWKYFLAYVAQSLAVESEGLVRWSLGDYQTADLAWMLDSQSLFHYTSALNTYGVVSQHPLLQNLGASQPGDPVATYAKLSKLSLIRNNRHSTIEGTLEWCRANMQHFYGSDAPANLQAHWQYSGWPPIDRVLDGTTHPQWGFAHWTAGCWGTVGFLRNTLRTLNIPVSLEPRDGHALPHFHLPRNGQASADLYLSHGDDPYNWGWIITPAVPISALPIDETTFQSWFGPNAPMPPGGSNVGRQTTELSMQYLSNYLLRCECADTAAGVAGQAQGSVFSPSQAGCGSFYSLAQLQALNLFARLDAKITALGGCANVP